MKVCSKCGDHKPFEDFHKNKRYKDGHTSYCKGCHSAYYQQYYVDNKPAYKKRAAEDFQKNKSAYYRRKYAYRAKLNKVDLTKEEKDQIDYMYWLARDLCVTSGEKYEVDHIMPIFKGGVHHPDNLQILPMSVNRSKGAKVL